MAGNTEWDISQIIDFGGGVNKTTSPFGLEVNQVRDANNVFLGVGKALQKRDGYTRVTTTSTSDALYLERIMRFYSDTQASRIVTGMSSTGRKIYKVSSASLVEITGGTDFGYNASIELFQFKDMRTNNTYALYYDGTSWDYSDENLSTRAACGFKTGTGQITDLKPDFMFTTDRRLFVHDPRYPNSLYYTAIDGFDVGGSPAAWDFQTTDYVPIQDSGPDSIGIVTAIRLASEDNPLIFRENDVWKLIGTGTSNYEQRQVVAPSGCIARRGICVTPQNTVVYVGNGRIYEAAGLEGVAISEDIEELLKDKDLTDAVAHYDVIRNIVQISANDLCLIWDCFSRAWTTSDLYQKDVAAGKASSDGGDIYFVKYGSPHVFKMWDGDVDDEHAATGTISSSGVTVTGIGTNFTGELQTGQYIIANSQLAVIESITSNTVLTTTAATAFSPVIAAGTSFVVGSYIPVRIITADIVVDNFYLPSIFRDCKFLVDSYNEHPFHVNVYANNRPVRSADTNLEISGGTWEDDLGTSIWDSTSWAAPSYVAVMGENDSYEVPNVDAPGAAIRFDLSNSDSEPLVLFGIAMAQAKTNMRHAG